MAQQSQTDIRESRTGPQASSNKKASSVIDFCNDFGISRALFYLLQRRGDGPRIMKVGNRTLVSTEAAQEWRERMEQRAAA